MNQGIMKSFLVFFNDELWHQKNPIHENAYDVIWDLGLGWEEKGARGNLILIGMPMVKNVLLFFDFDTTISNYGLDFNNHIYLAN